MLIALSGVKNVPLAAKAELLVIKLVALPGS
jgi:hypothetical protein